MRASAMRWLVLGLIAAGLGGGCSSRMLGPARALPIHPRTAALWSPGLAGKPPAKHPWYVKPNGRAWRHVVIHHSASSKGNAATFDTFHRTHRGWDELGYHFVIDNGRGGPDGRVEIGPRWTKQKHGAHTGQTPDNEYNEHGIGICLVGDFTASAGLPDDSPLMPRARAMNLFRSKARLKPTGTRMSVKIVETISPPSTTLPRPR